MPRLRLNPSGGGDKAGARLLARSRLLSLFSLSLSLSLRVVQPTKTAAGENLERTFTHVAAAADQTRGSTQQEPGLNVHH